MTVLTSITRNTPARATTSTREVSEFDGFWINAGVPVTSTAPGVDASNEETPWVRLPRGIAVSDLKPKKVYANMDPEYAAQVNLMNQMIEIIQGQCASLEEGESIPLNMELRLYRAQEETEVAATPKLNNDLKSALFG